MLAATTRLRLLETTQYTFLLRAILYAHQGMRADMAAALADLQLWEGDHPQHTPRVHGLARAWCALLEENRPLAIRELGLALTAEEENPTIFQLTGRYGLHLLLCVLEGTAGQPEYRAITAAPVSRLRWDRQFAVFAGAILDGRAGRGAAAAAAVTEAMRVGAPYSTGSPTGAAPGERGRDRGRLGIPGRLAARLRKVLLRSRCARRGQRLPGPDAPGRRDRRPATRGRRRTYRSRSARPVSPFASTRSCGWWPSG